MTDQQSAELSKPCVGAFDDPPAFVAPQFPAVLITSHLVILSVGARSVRCRVFSIALAVGPSRSLDPRSHVSAPGAASPLAGGRGLRQAWRPQT
jgi:hypothetical protein